MKRRAFITLLGGAAAAWPLTARAQQRTMPLVGFLHQGSAYPTGEYDTAALRRGLNKAGYLVGQNVEITYSWADNRLDRLPELAADLVRRKVSLIAATFSLAAAAAKAATSEIPIVFFTGTDPVRDGLVINFNRPGANVTGIAITNVLLGAKRVGLLRDLVPAAKTVALLINLTNRLVSENYIDATQTAARSAGLTLVILPASSEHEIDNCFGTMVAQRIGALIVAPDSYLDTRQHQIVALAARHSIPAIYSRREIVMAGGLASYAPDFAAGYREAGQYAGRILKGEKAGDLPVVQASKFELLLNLKTAKALDLTIPPDVLSIADDVIE